MTDKEKQYLNKRMSELIQKKTDLQKQVYKLDKEIKAIMKKLGE